MKFILAISLLLFASCKNHIDVDNTEQREHGLSYIKGTNKLVDGKVVRKSGGKMIELQSYKDGKMIGPFFQYDGQVVTKGFGIESENLRAGDRRNGPDQLYSFRSPGE